MQAAVAPTRALSRAEAAVLAEHSPGYRRSLFILDLIYAMDEARVFRNYAEARYYVTQARAIRLGSFALPRLP